MILAAGGEDGRFVEVGRARELEGVLPVAEVLAAGIAEIRTPGGAPVTRGWIDTNGGRVRPLLREHRPILLVEPGEEDRHRVIEQGKPHRARSDRCEA